MTATQKREVLEELRGNPLWQVHLQNRYWICPCCGQIGSAWKEPKEMLTEVLGHIRNRCPGSRNKKGQLLPIKDLRHRSRFLQIRNNLRKNPTWKYRDSKMGWYCPYCALPTGILVPEEGPISEPVLREMDIHLRHCRILDHQTEKSEEEIRISLSLRDIPEWGYFTFTGRWICPFCIHATTARIDSGKVLSHGFQGRVHAHLHHCKGGRILHSPSKLQEATKRADAIVKLGSRIRNRLHPKSVWTCQDREGSWICPYCRKSVYHIRFSNEYSIRESIPEMMAVHLVRNCTPFANGTPHHKQRIDMPGKTETTIRIKNLPPQKKSGDTTRIIQVIQDEIAGLRSEVESDREVKHSLEEARKMQRKMLPDIPTVEGYQFSTLYKPCHKVGGDFYDFIPFNDGKLGVVIGDVSGHGMEAALVMGMAKKAIQIHARQEDDPVEILVAANDEVREDLHANSFLTVTLGILDPHNHTFHYVRAGHTPLVLLNPSREKPVQVLQPGGTALGMVRSDRFFKTLKPDRIDLVPGDLLVQFTDGITETMNRAREEYGMDRLTALLGNLSERETDYICYKVESALERFQGKEEQQDDVALLAIRVNRNSEPSQP